MVYFYTIWQLWSKKIAKLKKVFLGHPTGYSCYFTAARRHGGRLFSWVDLVPRAAVGDMRIDTNTGYSCYLTAARRCQGCFFSLVDLGPVAVIGGMRKEKNTVLSCYLICNDSWRRMALQPNAVIIYSPVFLSLSVVVCLLLCLFPCICHCICLIYLYMTSKTFPQSCRKT